jgi:hypothetical protein
MKIILFSLILLGILASACQFFVQKKEVKKAEPVIEKKPSVVFSEKINGLTMVAPWAPFTDDPMAEVKSISANWIAVVPYAFTPSNGPARVVYNQHGQQWWGERPEGIAETVRRAHESSLSVMLKPQVYIDNNWTGSLEYTDQKDAENWEADYEKYILNMAQLAENQRIMLFCIGTEFRGMIGKRPEFWFQLIEKIRAIYHGKLTYSANWDDWSKVPFWSKLDFVGLGGYFPLVDEKEPSVEKIVAAWQPIRAQLQAFSDSLQKPILFTEYGYLTVDNCSWRNWELESNINSRPINQLAQANAMHALHTVFQKETWWAGGFLWKWFPNGMGHEGYPERDYTPQGKQSEVILKKWFEKK